MDKDIIFKLSEDCSFYNSSYFFKSFSRFSDFICFHFLKIRKINFFPYWSTKFYYSLFLISYKSSVLTFSKPFCPLGNFGLSRNATLPSRFLRIKQHQVKAQEIWYICHILNSTAFCKLEFLVSIFLFIVRNIRFWKTIYPYTFLTEFNHFLIRIEFSVKESILTPVIYFCLSKYKDKSNVYFHKYKVKI